MHDSAVMKELDSLAYLGEESQGESLSHSSLRVDVEIKVSLLGVLEYDIDELFVKERLDKSNDVFVGESAMDFDLIINVDFVLLVERLSVYFLYRENLTVSNSSCLHHLAKGALSQRSFLA